jgi:hypothetical protein
MIIGKLDYSSFKIELSPTLNSDLRNALVAALPFSSPVHMSRVAGNMVYVCTPIVVDPPQQGEPINDIAAGTWIFWHDRQLLECITGPINPEDASVTIVGHTVEGLEDLIAVTKKIQQGERLALQLRAENEPPAPIPEVIARGSFDERRKLAELREIADQFWREKPQLVARIEGRTGMMQPGGSLLFLESIASRHQEALWHIYQGREEYDRQSLADAIDLLMKSFAEQSRQTLSLTGHPFDEIEEVGLLIEHFSSAGVGEAAKHLIQIVGAIAHWSDIGIPWKRIADTFAQ